jgi:hypothetical protein
VRFAGLLVYPKGRKTQGVPVPTLFPYANA